jgi:hypothetical protein
MICPQCKDDYGDEGHTRCIDCGIDLVPALPPEPEPEYFKFEPVLATYSPADVAIIRSILDGEGIPYYIHGENFMHIRPLVEPARLMVDHDSVETVKELLKDLNLLITGLSFNRTEEDEEENR